ncbi:MAG: prolyl-tRNA synthetase [Candidatus Moranbacteria bacterium]|nr:prolyl-tRNA synthetase [Candidatus Moranbacteria bacterium]
MIQSKLFSKIRKESPKDEVSKNAQLLIRGGFIYKEMAGVYVLLPLGIRVIENIKQIVREEMNALGGQELLMSTLQRKELWEETDRWDDEKVDVWFKSRLKNDVEIGFGWSHEEPITKMLINYIESFRDLPVYVYQFQNKLRNELRAKSGIMRGREFIMKDLYSYSRTEEDHKLFYDSVIEAYHRIFRRLGIGEDTFLTFASGGAFTQFSHEFQTITDAGEDTIYVDRAKKIAINEEVFTDAVIKQLELDRKDLEKVKASEAGNIFSFGGKKSEDLGLFYTNKDGKKKPVILGSYGIGITRLMGIIVEKLSDERGMVWPEEIAPYKVHIISLEGRNDEQVRKVSEDIYTTFGEERALLDDRDSRAGEKFAEADFLGLPFRIVVSKRSLSEGGVELKLRREKESKIISLEEVKKLL